MDLRLNEASERILDALYPSPVRTAEDVTEDEKFGELEVSEYIIFLLALDTYMRYLEEAHGVVDDESAGKGLKLLRMADTHHQAAIQSFLGGNLPTDNQKKMLAKALSLRPTPEGASKRALLIRTCLSRGGAGTMKAVFSVQKARQLVKAAISASMTDDADKALDMFAVLPVRNVRLRDWIDLAAKLAGSGTAPSQVASVNTGGNVDETDQLLRSKIKEEAASATSQEGADARVKSEEILQAVQTTAQETAAKNLSAKGEPDVPPTKSEVVGIATAAAVAALSDPADDMNVPESIRHLDPEQRAAALTDGKVLVAAGAGAGKSTTLVARIDYLMKVKGVQPSRILGCSFNTKAANELKSKVAKKSGEAAMKRMSLGTMHSLFKSFIVGDRSSGIPAFGTREEQALFTDARLIADPQEGQKKVGPKPVNMTYAIRGIWGECTKVKGKPDADKIKAFSEKYGFPAKWVEETPKAKKMGLILNAWRGNDVSLEAAKASVKSKAEAQAYIWFETYQGLKGDLPGWQPPCGESPTAKKWKEDFRKGGERLGDMEDMIKVFRDILQRNPAAKKQIQGMYDHILVDECQDLNTIQHQVFDGMSEHVTDGADGKSLWMVGDDKQAIYQFRGARPDLFTSLDGREGWKTRMIKTNYRCEPEIVDAANKLVANNTGQIPMEARANPAKERGKASIEVSAPGDNAAGAIETVRRIVKDLETNSSAEPSDYAVLARTNAELNDYETACVIAELPYARVGGSSFLDSPESKAVLGVIDLASGADFEKMQSSLASILMKPDRGLFMGADKAEEIVKEAIGDLARAEGLDLKNVNPFEMLTKRKYAAELALALKKPFQNKLMEKGEWLWNKAVEELTNSLLELGGQVGKIRKEMTENPTLPVNDLLKNILDGVTATTGYYNRRTGEDTTKTVSLRDQITNDLSLYSDDDEDEDEEPQEDKPVIDEGGMKREVKEGPNPAQGLGAVQFLYLLSEPNDSDHTSGNDPSTADGFRKKLDRYTKTAANVKVDLKKWAKAQKLLPPDRREARPRCVILSTVHSVKGAEWKNCTVLMPDGIFPPKRKPDPDAPPPDPEDERKALEAERNLAYVALTRAAQNLRVVCPGGPSRFVFEAGLGEGENVVKPGAPEEPVKTAAYDFDTGPAGPPSFEDPEAINTEAIVSRVVARVRNAHGS